ncbi:unnamed protein product, partial [Timema podura]|nr:unnamed protein product [Timema podura]
MENTDESQATLEEPLVPSMELQLVPGAEDLSRKVEEMLLEKDKILEEFGHQRAKMKELYLQKDEELKRALSEKERLVEEVTKLGADLDESRSQVLLEGFRKEECMEEEKRRYQEEISSLQQLVQ